MDRVAFLRSLPYLRQLDPEIWAAATTNGSGDGDFQEIYSGSTITPPTPSNNNSLLLFEESAVVSIEPQFSGGIRKSNRTANGEDDDKIMDMDEPTRKRGRADLDIDAPTIHYESSAPAFFQQYELDTEERVMDNKLEDPKEIDFQSINNDPALCSFEAAIVKHIPNPLGSPVQQDGEANCNDDHGTESNWLLFRFGCRFVYLVDTNAIINVTYEPSIAVDENDGSEKSKDAIQSPPMKRQKNTTTEGEIAQAQSTNDIEKVTPPPASLVVSFQFCSFRLFSLPHKNDNSAQEGTNGTTRSFLLKTAMTAEETLLKARSMLLKHFDEEKAQKEKMSSGLSFAIGFVDEAALVVNSDIPPFLVSKASKFLDEDWSFCVDVNKTMPCTSLPSSPQKSTTPSKIEGSSSSAKDSSTPFENGQKVGVPKHQLNESSKDDEGWPSTDGGIGDRKEDASGDENLEEGDKGTDSVIKDAVSNDVGDETISSTEKKEKHITDAEKLSWKHELWNKRCDFDASWSSVQKGVHDKTSKTQTQQDGGISHLTRAAQSLSSSYLTPKELFDKSSQCEDDIEAANKGIEKEIERIFPGRGKKPPGSSDLGNFKEKVEHLMRLRKESVGAKLALLLTPKR